MENTLFQSIDLIDDAVETAVLETTIALTDAYVKAYHILESVDETTDISAFTVFQEGLFGDKNESTLKKVLLFIPRLIVGIITLIITIVFNIIKFVIIGVGLLLMFTVGLPITLGIGIHKIKKFAKEVTEEMNDFDSIDIDFNPAFIETFVDEFCSFTDDLVENINSAKSSDSTENPVIVAIRKMMERGDSFNKYLSSLRKQVDNFDEDAYKKTTMQRGEAKRSIQAIKENSKKLSKNVRVISKYKTSTMPTPENPDKTLSKFAELSTLLTDWAKKGSELSKKLKGFANDVEKAATNKRVTTEEAVRRGASAFGFSEEEFRSNFADMKARFMNDPEVSKWMNGAPPIPASATWS